MINQLKTIIYSNAYDLIAAALNDVEKLKDTWVTIVATKENTNEIMKVIFGDHNLDAYNVDFSSEYNDYHFITIDRDYMVSVEPARYSDSEFLSDAGEIFYIDEDIPDSCKIALDDLAPVYTYYLENSDLDEAISSYDPGKSTGSEFVLKIKAELDMEEFEQKLVDMLHVIRS